MDSRGTAEHRDPAGEWWKGFFDADYVDAFSAAGRFDDTEALVDGVERLLGLSSGAAVLDIACGFGRVAGPLARRGYRVTGLDLSVDQLRLARERNPGPTYVQGDMRRPPPGPFDGALNLFSSFGYFDEAAEDLTALAAWAGCLRPGGVLVMELMHRDRVAQLHGAAIDHPNGITETDHTDWVTGVRTSTLTYGSVEKTFRVRLYTVTELVRALHDVGFREVTPHGGVEGGEVTPATRLALRAVR